MTTPHERNTAILICAIAAGEVNDLDGYGDIADELGLPEDTAAARRAHLLAVYALDHVRVLHDIKITQVKRWHHAEAAQLLREGWTA